MKKTLILILTLTMALSLLACSGTATTEPTNEPAQNTDAFAEINADTFRHYSDEQWLAESFDGKAIAYQFVSPETNTDSIDYGYAFATCINLYTDGSAVAYHRNVIAGKTDRHFGFWTKTESEYGDSITLTIRRVVALDGNSLLDHKYEYTIYEEDGGTYSSNFDFGITPGAYFRQIAVAGSANVVYPTPEDFYAAVDTIVETHRFVSAEPNQNFTAEIHLYSNNTAMLSLFTEYNGANTAVANAEGTVGFLMNETNTEVVGYRISATHAAIGDIEIDLSPAFDAFVWNVNFSGVDFTFDMQPAEIPAE